MVGHQDASVELAASLSEGVVQPVEVGEVIFFVQKAGVAVVPALHDVQGQTVKMGTATTWHSKSVSRAEDAVATGVKLSLAPFFYQSDEHAAMPCAVCRVPCAVCRGSEAVRICSIRYNCM